MERKVSEYIENYGVNKHLVCKQFNLPLGKWDSFIAKKKFLEPNELLRIVKLINCRDD